MPDYDLDSMSLAAKRWHAQWHAEGKAEGKVEGKAETLLALLSRRFGQPSEAARERVAAARPEDLERWLERILDAKSLEEVFGEH